MTIFIALLLAALVLVNVLFVVESAAGLQRLSPRRRSAGDAAATIIMPAHNEGHVLARSLDRLTVAAGGDFNILVVADNCTDDTAVIARRANVMVVERHDMERRGKGFALAFAREALREAPPPRVIVIDADCSTDGASLRALAGTCRDISRPCQAINLLEPRPSAAPVVQISTFAFLFKNLVRQRGLQRLTGGVHLTGTGMCLPWSQFDQADLATSNIVEDVRLGIELARKGVPTQLVEDAIVWSAPSDTAGTLTQRSRWEGGVLSMARQTAPSMIVNGLRTFDLKAVIKGLDLLIPPLAMLALLDVAALLGAILMAILGRAGWAPAILLAFVTGAVAAMILVVWWREGRRFLTLQAALRLPLYVLWKVPMYLGLVRRGAPAEWLRTGRPPQEDR